MTRVRSSTGTPCAQCPWRTSNQGKRHPGGWYTKANLRRLWVGMRRGEAMTCHPTDPNNPVPDGVKPAPENAQTIECAGALILQQRELRRFEAICRELPEGDTGALKLYRKAHPRGLTREGLILMAQRIMFGGTPLSTRPSMPFTDLDQPVGHPDLVPWEGKP